MPQMSWEETRSIMAEVQELFAGREDMSTVEEIRAIQKELRDAMATREAGAQAFIRGLTAEVATRQEAAAQLPAAQEAAKAQRAAVEAGKAALQAAVDGVAAQIAAAKQSVGDLEAEAAEVEDKAKVVDSASREQAPRVLHALSLYANITGIRWKYDDDEHQHLIRGFVSLPGGDEVREFCLDCTKESTFKIANSVWDMIDPPKDAAAAPVAASNPAAAAIKGLAPSS